MSWKEVIKINLLNIRFYNRILLQNSKEMMEGRKYEKTYRIFAFLMTVIIFTSFYYGVIYTKAQSSNGPLVPVESIEDQMRSAWARGEKPILESPLKINNSVYANNVTNTVTKKVRIIIYNPINTNISTTTYLSDSAAIVANDHHSWMSEADMITQSQILMNLIFIDSGGTINLLLEKAIHVSEFPKKIGTKEFVGMQPDNQGGMGYSTCFYYYLQNISLTPD